MSLIKILFKVGLYLSYLGISSFLLLEFIFRILPTSNTFEIQVTNADQPIIRFEENIRIRNSLGKNFYQTAIKETNNYGFVSSKDYRRAAEPDVMVIGDSYVEAMQVDNDESVSELIEFYDPDLNIYAIGISGVPLSQYIKFVEYSEKEFNPSEYLIIIAGNDFNESICDIRPKQGTYCFNNDWGLSLVDFNGYSNLRKLARSSAFMRYLVFNVKLEWRSIISNLGLNDPGLLDEAGFAGNTERYVGNLIESASKKVVDEFLERISNISNGKKITLLIDADRQDIYNGFISESYFRTMRNYLMAKAETHDISTIDMEPIFQKHYQEYGNQFDFSTDGHWNELGHELAARAFLAAD